jgi:DNA-binding response OmpR family regulator
MANDLPSILIVDDDESTLEVLPLLLEMGGNRYDLATCSTFLAAKQIMSRKRVDLFILDYLMPEKNASDFCRELRKVCYTVPIIIYSAISSPDIRKEAINAGADLYLIKPNDLDRLPTVVSQQLRKARGKRPTAAMQNTLASAAI